MLPRPYVVSYSGEKGHQFLHKPWIIALAKSVEKFILVSIYVMPTIKYWKILGRTMEKAKEMIPKECRIGDTCFTSLETIGGNLFTRHPKNLNHVHKDSNDLLSVIIIFGTNVHSGDFCLWWIENEWHWKKSSCSEALTWKVCGWGLW